MCPFVNEDEEDDYAAPILHAREKNTCFMSQFFKSDRKLFLIGGGVSVTAFVVIAYILYSNSKPINLEELPVISADGTPLKIKPETSEQIKHQDKIVYDSISGQKRKVEEKVAQPVEEILSIPEVDTGEALSDEEKKNIIQAFDDLAPEKEYRIKYVKKDVPKIKSSNLTVIEGEGQPPIKKVEEKNVRQVAARQKSSSKNLNGRDKVDHVTLTFGDGYMVQIASIATKSAAEMEYGRILSRNKFLRGFSKKIVKIDLGEKKGIKYRVQIGPFKSKSEAGKIISQMKKNGFPAYISK